MYISGQLGMDPASGQLVGGGVQAQTRQVGSKSSFLGSLAYFSHCSGCEMSTSGKSSCRLSWIWVKSSRLLDAVMTMVKKHLRIWPHHLKVPSSESASLLIDCSPVVVKATVLLADMNDFNAVNDVYKQCKCHYFYSQSKWNLPFFQFQCAVIPSPATRRQWTLVYGNTCWISFMFSFSNAFPSLLNFHTCVLVKFAVFFSLHCKLPSQSCLPGRCPSQSK